MKKIAIIPARSGSKGLINKNVLFINGKPMLLHSIDLAIAFQKFEKIILTTDSKEYLELVKDKDVVQVLRNKSLSSDSSSTYDVIVDVLNKVDGNFDYFVLLQPTSPLRTLKQLNDVCSLFEKNYNNSDFLASVSPSKFPSFLVGEIENNTLKNFKLNDINCNRQKYKYFVPNGSFFIAKPKAYLENKNFFGEKSIPYIIEDNTSIDIDSKNDFLNAFIALQTKPRKFFIKRDLLNSHNYNTLVIGDSILAPLNKSFCKMHNINNLSYPGISSSDLIEDIDQYNMESVKNVVINIGTNDNQYCIPMESTIDNIIKIIELLNDKKKNIKIFIFELFPIAFRLDRDNNYIDKLNKKINLINKKNVYIIKSNSLFKDKYKKLNFSYTNDGLHLNEKGLKLVEDILKKYEI